MVGKGKKKKGAKDSSGGGATGTGPAGSGGGCGPSAPAKDKPEAEEGDEEDGEAKPKKGKGKKGKGKGSKSSKFQGDIFNEAAMENAYYICHNIQDVLKSRGFAWPEGQKKKKKGKNIFASPAYAAVLLDLFSCLAFESSARSAEWHGKEKLTYIFSSATGTHQRRRVSILI
uniref:Small lysine-rich protein 1 n=1 Tax=Anopheles merus TaxID=30066 RepID=A0A182UU69_ANOME